MLSFLALIPDAVLRAPVWLTVSFAMFADAVVLLRTGRSRSLAALAFFYSVFYAVLAFQ